MNIIKILILTLLLFPFEKIFSQKIEGTVNLYSSFWHVRNYKEKNDNKFRIKSINNELKDSSLYFVYYVYKGTPDVLLHGNFKAELVKVSDLDNVSELTVDFDYPGDSGKKGFWGSFRVPPYKKYKIYIYSGDIRLNSTIFFSVE